MKYKTKANEKGITLIALIITIIILVILAAISIKAVYESKIVNYAINGVTDYAEESVRENEILNSTASLLESAIGKKSGMTGGSEEGINFSSLSDGQKEELIGKYVAYTPNKSEFSDHQNADYSGYSNNSTLKTEEDLNWRILFIDDDKITLISEKPTNDVFYLQGANGYNNAVLLLNNACEKLYSNGSYATGRSLNIEDIEEALGINPETEAGGETETYNGSYAHYPKIFESEISQIVDGKEGYLGQSDQEGAYITDGAILASSYITAKHTYYYYNLTTANNTIYKEMFAGSGNSYRYWLASRCVNLDSPSALFYVCYVDSGGVNAYDLYYSNGLSFGISYALRPVVEINLSSVSIGASGDGSSSDPYTITAK